MASTDATPIPIYGQAWRAPVAFRDTSGNLITSWTSASSLISKDGAATAAGGTPTEIGTSGMGYLDLTALQMTAQVVWVKCTITNSNFTHCVFAIYPEVLTEITGKWDDQAVKRPVHFLMNLAQRLLNRNVKAGSTLTVYKADGSTISLTGQVVESDTSTSMGDLA